jgi:PIN domain nuclease of toxin-antitoxin system
MILFDTHIWIWYLSGSSMLGEHERRIIAENAGDGFAVSMISCWEVATLVEVQRIHLSQPVEDWLNTALSHPNIQAINLTTRIVVCNLRATVSSFQGSNHVVSKVYTQASGR